MVKKPSDFNNEEEYVKYTRTPEFLSEYQLDGKEPEVINHEMRFPENWLPYVKKALPVLSEQGNLKGYDLYFFVDDLLMQEDDYLITEGEIKEAEEKYKKVKDQ